MKKCIFIICFFAISKGVFAAKKIKQKGYLINFNYEWYFQPCERKSFFYRTLNHSSFRIITGTDGYNQKVNLFSDSMQSFFSQDTVDYYLDDSKDVYIGYISYVYCEVEYSLDSFAGQKKISPCKYQIISNSSRYNLFCVSSLPTIFSLKKL